MFGHRFVELVFLIIRLVHGLVQFKNVSMDRVGSNICL